MSETRLYVRHRGKIMGPFGQAQLVALRDRGQLKRFHELSPDKQRWVSAGSVADLFSAPVEIEVVNVAPAATAPAKVAAAPVVEQWHYALDDGQRLGPVPRDTLRAMAQAGQIEPTTLVWREGLTEWLPLASAGVLPRSKASSGGTAELWRVVRTGLAIKIAEWFVCWIGGLLLVAMFTVAVQSGKPAAVLVVSGLLILQLATGCILATVGQSMVAVAPVGQGRGYGLTGFVLLIVLVIGVPMALASLVMFVPSVALSAATFAAADTARGLPPGVATDAAGQVAGVAVASAVAVTLVVVLFVIALFLPILDALTIRAVQIGCGLHALSRTTLYLVVLYCVMVFFELLTILASFLATGQGGAAIVMLLTFMTMLIMLASSGWFLAILFQTRRGLAPMAGV